MPIAAQYVLWERRDKWGRIAKVEEPTFGELTRPSAAPDGDASLAAAKVAAQVLVHSAGADQKREIEPLRSENSVLSSLLQDTAPVDGGAADAAARTPERKAQEQLAQSAGRDSNTEPADEHFTPAVERIHRWTSPRANSFPIVHSTSGGRTGVSPSSSALDSGPGL